MVISIVCGGRRVAGLQRFSLSSTSSSASRCNRRTPSPVPHFAEKDKWFAFSFARNVWRGFSVGLYALWLVLSLYLYEGALHRRGATHPIGSRRSAKLWRARSRLYRRQILQVSTRWKAIAEIYKFCMLLHRPDLNISAKFRQAFWRFQSSKC